MRPSGGRGPSGFGNDSRGVAFGEAGARFELEAAAAVDSDGNEHERTRAGGAPSRRTGRRAADQEVGAHRLVSWRHSAFAARSASSKALSSNATSIPQSFFRLLGMHAARLALRPWGTAAATVRRLRRRASCRRDEVEQRLERVVQRRRYLVPGRRARRSAAGTVASVKSRRVDARAPRPSRAGTETRASGIGRTEYARGDGAVARVLVVVDEDAVALFLPPRRRGERRDAALDFAPERERAAPHVGELPLRLDAHVDVDAARAGRLGEAAIAELLQHLVDRERDLA